MVDNNTPFTLSEVKDAQAKLKNYVVQTPVLRLYSSVVNKLLGDQAEVLLKLELFQRTGTFKARGAINSALNCTPEQIRNGFTAVSAGNHAVATAFAAQMMGTTAKVVMIESANPMRVAKCRQYGGEIVFADDVHTAFEIVKKLQSDGYTFLHPFDGRNVSIGTATLGLEFVEQVDGLEAVVVAIGGGGLASGVSMAVKTLAPNCKVYGVEPEGADTMRRSFSSGQPEALDRINTIADSLGAPYALPYSFSLCRKYLDQISLVSDIEMIKAMSLLLSDLQLVIEPAGATALAAVLNPLREQLQNKKTGVIVCGSNIDLDTYLDHMALVPPDSSFEITR